MKDHKLSNRIHTAPMAMVIAKAMHTHYKYDLPALEKLEALERSLRRLEIRTSLAVAAKNLPTSDEVTKELKTLKNAVQQLAHFAEADGRTKARVLRYLENQHTENESGDYISPNHLFETAKVLLPAFRNAKRDAKAMRAADLSEELLELAPSASSNNTWKTELLGSKLPDLYRRVYPEGKSAGPQRFFVGEAYNTLVGEYPTNETIRGAQRKYGDGQTNG